MKPLIIQDEFSEDRLAAVSLLETLLHCSASVSVVSSVLLRIVILNQKPKPFLEFMSVFLRLCRAFLHRAGLFQQSAKWGRQPGLPVVTLLRGVIKGT